MMYAILWVMGVFACWLLISGIMFVFSMGQLSALEGAGYNKQYWKWSILLSILTMIPFLGWIIGYSMLSAELKRSPAIIKE